jgi:microcystin-dependent protein
MDGQFLGQILTVGFSYAPKSWATCSAQLLPIAQNQALFAILGTTYGGNGVQTFALPDLRGRVPMSWGQGPGLSDYVLGQQAGTQSVTMLANNVPLHTHTFSVNNGAAAVPVPTNNALSQGGQVSGIDTFIYSTNSPNATMNPLALQTSGSSVPFSILQPYTAILYCIALQGIFPSRN